MVTLSSGLAMMGVRSARGSALISIDMLPGACCASSATVLALPAAKRSSAAQPRSAWRNSLTVEVRWSVGASGQGALSVAGGSELAPALAGSAAVEGWELCVRG